MKINFEYSSAYDMMLSEMIGNETDAKKSQDFLSSVRTFWSSNGNKIIKEIEKVSKLKFNREIDCFVVSSMLYESISHPFTIKFEKSKDKLLAIFVHELTHILLAQNFKNAAKTINLINGDHDYKVHFPVLLIERRVLEKLHKDYKMEKRIEDLDYIWSEVNKVYPEFHNYSKGIVPFLKENVVNRPV